MKNSKAMALGLCVVLLVAMTGGMAVGQNNAYFSDIIDAGGEVASATYPINIPADGYTFDIYSDLADDIFGSTTGTLDYDLYVVTVGTPCTGVGFSMMDCCIAGDTIAFGIPPAIFSATSPMPACVGAPLPPGTYNIYAGYVAATMFPAGYDMHIKGYWPVPPGAAGASNIE